MNQLPQTGYLRLSQILGNKKSNPPTAPIINHLLAEFGLKKYFFIDFVLIYIYYKTPFIILHYLFCIYFLSSTLKRYNAIKI